MYLRCIFQLLAGNLLFWKVVFIQQTLFGKEWIKLNELLLLVVVTSVTENWVFNSERIFKLLPITKIFFIT